MNSGLLFRYVVRTGDDVRPRRDVRAEADALVGAAFEAERLLAVVDEIT